MPKTRQTTDTVGGRTSEDIRHTCGHVESHDIPTGERSRAFHLDFYLAATCWPCFWRTFEARHPGPGAG